MSTLESEFKTFELMGSEIFFEIEIEKSLNDDIERFTVVLPRDNFKSSKSVTQCLNETFDKCNIHFSEKGQ